MVRALLAVRFCFLEIPALAGRGCRFVWIPALADGAVDLLGSPPLRDGVLSIADWFTLLGGSTRPGEAGVIRRSPLRRRNHDRSLKRHTYDDQGQTAKRHGESLPSGRKEARISEVCLRSLDLHLRCSMADSRITKDELEVADLAIN